MLGTIPSHLFKFIHLILPLPQHHEVGSFKPPPSLLSKPNRYIKQLEDLIVGEKESHT